MKFNFSGSRLSAPAQGETGTASSAINGWGTTEAGGNGDGSNDNTHPKAFINIILFDKNYNFLDISYAQVTSSGTPGYITASYAVKEAGYAYLYISNEQPVQTDVYFDDVKMTYTPTNVIQYNEYYPFGLQASTSWTRTSNKNNYLYNDGSELNSNSGWYETFFRGYDAALGRFHQTDPMASSFTSQSPYHYAYNNPILVNDPKGAAPVKALIETNPGLDGGTGTGRSFSDNNNVYADAATMDMDDFVAKYGTTVYGPSENENVDPADILVALTVAITGEEFEADGQEGDPNYQQFVNPLSFNLTHVSNRYVTYVNYSEIFGDILDVRHLKVYDQLNLEINKLAVSVSVDGFDDPKVRSKLTSAFDQARFQLFGEFDERGITDMMTDSEGVRLFVQYLNARLQIYFPSSTETFARPNHEFYWLGDVPTSTITFIGPYYNPN